MKVEVYPTASSRRTRNGRGAASSAPSTWRSSRTGPLLAFAPGRSALSTCLSFPRFPARLCNARRRCGKDLLGKFDTRGIHGLAWWENGWRHLTAKKEISKPEDLTGLKLRTMQNPCTWPPSEKLGASPVPMVWGEVFTSLGQGVIDAQENPITVIYVNSLWEVQSHLILTGHVYGPHVALFSKMKWDSLTPEQQTAVSEAAAEATGFQREKAAELEKDYLAKLKEKGMTVVEIDTTSFRDALRDLAASQQNIDPALLEKIQSVQ